MNYNNQQSRSGDLNYLVVNYLENLPSLSNNDKSQIIHQIKTNLDYGIVFNTELTPFPSDYSLRKEMFNRLKYRALEDIVDDFLHFNKEDESLIQNEYKSINQNQSAKCSMFDLMRRIKVGKIERGTEKKLQRDALQRYQYMKSMLGHISLIDNTMVNPVPIYCVAYSENDEMIFTADNNGLIKIWSTQTGALIDIFKSHDKPINDFLLIKNYLVSCSEDKSVIIWNTTTLQLSKVFNFDESIVRVISYQYKNTKSGNEHNLIIICSLSAKIYFVDLDSAVQKKSAIQMELEEEESFPIKFYFDKKIVEKYNLKRIKTMQQSCICANSKHGILICGYNDGLICVWDIKKILDDSIMNKRFIHEFSKYVLFLDYVHSSNVHISEFSHSSFHFITGSIDGHVLVWKVLDEIIERLRSYLSSNNKGLVCEYPIYSVYKICETEDRTRCAVNCSIWTKKSNYILAIISSKKRKRATAVTDTHKTHEPSFNQPTNLNNNNNNSPNHGDSHSNKRSSSLIVYSLSDNKVIKRYNEANGFNCHDECFVLESHPVFEDIILTISETSDIILFNILTGETLAKFKNNNYFFTNTTQNVIASEGKFSSKGDSFAISTFLGFISMYSIYSPNSFSSTYMNQFFSSEFPSNSNHSNNNNNEALALETIFPTYVNMYNLPQISNQPYPKTKLRQIDLLRPILQAKFNLTTKEIEHRFSRDNYENYDKNVNERRIECEKEEQAFNQAIQDNMTYRLTEQTDLIDIPDEEDNNTEDDASYHSQEEVIEVDSYNNDKLSGDDQMLIDENRDNFIQPTSGRGNYSLRNRRGNQSANNNSQQQQNSNRDNDRIHTRSYDQHQQSPNNASLSNNNTDRLRKRLRLRRNRVSLSNNRENNDSDIEYEKAINATTLGRRKKKLKNRIDDSIDSVSEWNEEKHNENNDEDEYNKDEGEDEYNEENDSYNEENDNSNIINRSRKKQKVKTHLSNTKNDLLQKLSKDGQSHQCFCCKFYNQSIFGPFYLNQSTKASFEKPISESSDEIYLDMNCLFNFNDFIIINHSTGSFNMLLTIEAIIKNKLVCYRCNSLYATKKCSDNDCPRYFHGNYCLNKMCIDYTNTFKTQNNFTQCLTCYRNNFSDELVNQIRKIKIEMEKVPKNFFLSEKVFQSSFFPQKNEIVYFILQGYEVFLKANFEYIIYELPTDDNTLYDDIFFWKETNESKKSGNKNTINYHLPFKCQIEKIEYAFLSDKSYMLIEKMYISKNIVEKIKIIIKMQLNILENNRRIQIVFLENEQPDFLIREKVFEHNREVYLNKMNSNDLNVQMFIDNEISNAVIIKHKYKENNNAFGESLYENMSIRYYITNNNNNANNINNDQSEELMEISFWDLYDSAFNCENISIRGLSVKVANQISKLMNKNEDNLYMFFDCVDETRDNALNYYNIVPVPMYLRLIKERLIQGYYLTIESIKYDVELMLTNALKYNTEQSVIVNNARILVKRLNDYINDSIKENLKDFRGDNIDQRINDSTSNLFLGKKKRRINQELGLDSLGLDEDDLLFNQRSLRKRGVIGNNKESSENKLLMSMSIHTTSSKTDKKETLDNIKLHQNIQIDEEMKKNNNAKSLRPRNKFNINHSN